MSMNKTKVKSRVNAATFECGMSTGPWTRTKIVLPQKQEGCLITPDRSDLARCTRFEQVTSGSGIQCSNPLS